jgi:hypothetical protein
MDHPSREIEARLEHLVGRRARTWTRVHSGYAPTARWVVGLADGGSVFVKAGTTPSTDEALRKEHPNLAYLAAYDLAPDVVAWEDGEPPILVLEDLSRAHWPPPWTAEQIKRVMATLERVARIPPPPWLGGAEALREPLSGWAHVKEDPGPFLSLGVASAGWLKDALPVLAEAEAKAKAVFSGSTLVVGDALVHLDVRSDNICFAGDRTVLIDWNHAAVGNPALDRAFFAPTLPLDGAGEPDQVCDDEPELAALFVGAMAKGLGRPPEPGLEKVAQLRIDAVRASLPWAARLLGLPPPE